MGHPVFEVWKRYDANGKKLLLSVKQIQKIDPKDGYPQTEFFKGKMQIEIDDKINTIVLEPQLENTFEFASAQTFGFSRGEPKKMLPYDEESYAKNAQASLRSMDDLLDELILVRKSFIALFRSFTPEMLRKIGSGFKGEYSVVSIGFMIAGRQHWHFKVFEEKYLPLLV